VRELAFHYTCITPMYYKLDVQTKSFNSADRGALGANGHRRNTGAYCGKGKFQVDCLLIAA
jgi:hypothetical protein